MKRSDKFHWLPMAAVLATTLVLFSTNEKSASSSFDFDAFAKIPVLNRGRVKPLDSIARSSLLLLSGRQSIRTEGTNSTATGWLLDMMYRPGRVDDVPVFEIDNPDVLALMKMQQTTKRRFSLKEIQPYLDVIAQQANQAMDVKAEERDRFQTAIVNFGNQLMLYRKLQNTAQISGSTNETLNLRLIDQNIAPLVRKHLSDPHHSAAMKSAAETLAPYRFMAEAAEFFPLPTTAASSKDLRWISIGEGVLTRLLSGSFHPGVVAFAAIGDALRSNDPSMFNQAVSDYTAWLNENAPHETTMAATEWEFNRISPFTKAMMVYVMVFLLVMASWVATATKFSFYALNRTAFALLVLAFAIHTVGLVSRMWIQGRPPVTNLYSSAIFVGWFAVGLGLILEKIFRRGLGAAVASAIGFSTLIIAHHLAAQGDTLEMMRAVLDSNFWLATHVVCITIGYSSTFLSGFLGMLYVLRRRFDRSWTHDTARALESMAFGIICFATFFSFLGTILGGIWADQSWGRFWGWDPKENGALMIVLWNVFTLHAVIGRIVKRPTMMLMTVFGNIVTAFSWFGVNMLGIGLHSYGFMEKAFVWLLIFSASQIAIIILGLLLGNDGDGFSDGRKQDEEHVAGQSH